MKSVRWTCDRCGTVASLPYATVLVEEYTPRAVRSGFEPETPDGWREFADDEQIYDVCPDCETVVERAELIVALSEIPF